MKTEVGVRLPEAKGHLETQEVEEAKNDPPLEA